MPRILLITVVVLCFVYCPVSDLISQEDIYPKEKVYIHTDRAKYGAGETIYFSAYHDAQVYDGNIGESRVLYVELIDEDGEQMAYQWLKLYNGRAAGSIDTKYQLSSQVITLRAYTKYMRNFDEAFFFKKRIEIVGLDGPMTDRAQSSELSLQAFPEGGDLINDVVSIIGVKLERGGKGFSGKIELLQDDQPIGSVDTNEYGFGRVVIKPQSGSRYVLNYNGEKHELPVAKDQGLNIGSRTTTELFTIYVNAKDVPDIVDYSAIIIAQGQALYHEKLENAILKLTKSTLPIGLLTIAILDPHNRPVCERLLFNHYGIDKLSIKVNNPSPIPSTRSLITIPIDVHDMEGKPIIASLSAAVVDNNYYTGESGIEGNFLLQSEIKGIIENPDQYLISNQKEVIEKTDLLLLTQGWRGYNWAQSGALEYDKEQGIALAGRTVKPKKVTDGMKTYGTLSILDESFDIIPIETDNQGYFEVGEIDRFGVVPLFFQVGTKKPKDANKIGGAARGNTNVEILLDKPTTHPISNREAEILNDVPYVGSTKKDLNYNVDAIADDEFYINEGLLLDEVTIEAKKVDEWVDYYDDVISYTPSGNRVFTDNIAALGGYRDIYDILRGRVTGIEITSSASGQSRRDVIIRGSSSGLSASTAGNNAAGFLLNGSLVTAATAESISPVDIAFIDVIKGLSQLTQFGSEGSGGIIAIYLKPPGARSNSRTSQSSTKKDNGIYVDYQGYSRSKEFYKVNYGATGSYEKESIRRTVHWEPMIITDEEGAASISFYTSDYIGSYHIDVQGVSENGTPMSYHTTFTVK